MSQHDVPPAVTELAERLRALGWMEALLVAGSLATGDYTPGISDLDLVAVTDGAVDPERLGALVGIHHELDQGSAAGLALGCVYAPRATLADRAALHPTWTHGGLVHRILSGITRAELVRHGFSLLGPAPQDLLDPMSADDVREAARAEVSGYWAWAVRRPKMWLDPMFADLSLTAMARGRHTLRTGELLTKSQAVEQAGAPPWLVDQLRARRTGGRVTSPRLRTALISWWDAWATVGAARRAGPRS